MNWQKVYEKTAKEFAEKVIKRLDGSIDSIIVYGSVARGNARKDSDIDILIISKKGRKIENEVLNAGYDIDLKNKTVTTHIYLTPKDLEREKKFGSFFTHDVLTQGRVLYDNGTFKRIREKAFRTGR